MFYDETGNLIPVHKLPEDAARAIAGLVIEDLPGGRSVPKRIKFAPKLAAWDLLAKHLGMFPRPADPRVAALGFNILINLINEPDEPVLAQRLPVKPQRAVEVVTPSVPQTKGDTG